MVVAMWAVVGIVGSPQKHPSRFPDSRFVPEGDVWMSWNHSQRDMFVRGYIAGHREGYRLACRTALKVMKPLETISESPFSQCMAGGQGFRKEISHYEKFLTEFYSKYPGDRDVPLRILLAEAEDKTLEQVHEWVSKMGK
jgi:hypothetical protein